MDKGTVLQAAATWVRHCEAQVLVYGEYDSGCGFNDAAAEYHFWDCELANANRAFLLLAMGDACPDFSDETKVRICVEEILQKMP